MKRVNLGLGLFLTIVLVATIFAGCTAAPKAEAPKQMNATVRVVMLADLTGPYGVTTGPQLDGLADFTKWANETNYIPGITLESKIYDHGLKAESAIALYKEGVSENPARLSPMVAFGVRWPLPWPGSPSNIRSPS